MTLVYYIFAVCKCFVSWAVINYSLQFPLISKHQKFWKISIELKFRIKCLLTFFFPVVWKADYSSALAGPWSSSGYLCSTNTESENTHLQALKVICLFTNREYRQKIHSFEHFTSFFLQKHISHHRERDFTKKLISHKVHLNAESKYCHF